ncbi:hypothetical protein [Streptomyces sp. NPDC088915]|uniref:hypothetical protein n=1 Tax=Streptomyces sp. NPDC088915 TaxID=3365912 RepID=UPI003818A967
MPFALGDVRRHGGREPSGEVARRAPGRLLAERGELGGRGAGRRVGGEAAFGQGPQRLRVPRQVRWPHLRVGDPRREGEGSRPAVRVPSGARRPFRPGDEVELAPGVVLTRSGRRFPAELAGARRTVDARTPVPGSAAVTTRQY